MKKIPIILLSFIVLLTTNCTDSESLTDSVNTPGTSFNVYNFTGHLVRRSGTACGSGIKVAFVLSSKLDRQEYTFDADTYRSVSLEIDRGEAITVQAFEIDGENRILLTQNRTMYDPKDDSAQLVNPEIVLCPKDQIEFYDFN